MLNHNSGLGCLRLHWAASVLFLITFINYFMHEEVTGQLVGISSLLRPYGSQDRSSDLTTKAFTH